MFCGDLSFWSTRIERKLPVAFMPDLACLGKNDAGHGHLLKMPEGRRLLRWNGIADSLYLRHKLLVAVAGGDAQSFLRKAPRLAYPAGEPFQ